MEFFSFSLVVEPESETSSHVKRVVYHRLYRSLIDVISDNSSVAIMVINIRNITNQKEDAPDSPVCTSP